MQPTYFTSFFVGKTDQRSETATREVLSLIERWIFENRFREISKPDTFNLSENGEHFLSDSVSVQNRFVPAEKFGDGSGVFAVRYEHSDKQRRRWRTDIVLDAQRGFASNVRCSVGISVANTNSAIAPIGDVESRPRIVPDIINNVGAYEAFPLTAEPMIIDLDDVELFSQLLQNAQRTVPVLLVTGCNNDDTPIIGTKHLANQLAGLSYICVAKSRDVTYAIREKITPNHHAFDGAVRLYWPGFQITDHKFKHPLWVRDKLESTEYVAGAFAKDILKLLSRLSATRFVDGIARWEDVQKLRFKERTEESLEKNELLEALEDAWNDSAQLRADLDTAKHEIQLQTQQIEQKDEQIDYWRGEYEKSRRRLTQDNENIAPVANNIDSVDDAIERIANVYEDYLTIVSPALRKEASLYEYPKQIFEVLKWLATTYRDAKLGKSPGINLDLSCRECTSWWYKPNQSEITMSNAKGDYSINLNGETLWLEEHVGKGSGTDPRYNARIAFCFDERQQKVIVGFIGQHQKTKKSN